MRQIITTPCHRSRQGISLIEVLLSISLGLVLLAGVYASLEQSARLSVLAREEHQRGHVARGVIRLFARDLQSVDFTPPTDSDEEGEQGLSSFTDSSGSAGSEGSDTRSQGNDSGDSESEGADPTGNTGTGNSLGENSTGNSEVDALLEEVIGETTTIEEQVSQGSWGIRGNATLLELTSARPTRGLSTARASTGSGTTTATNFAGDSAGGTGSSALRSDLKTISYWIGDGVELTSTGQSSTGSASTTPATGSTTSGSAKNARPRRGLVRQESDRWGNVLGPAELIAPEIESFSVRFHDGLAWSSQWDSAEQEALPRAIEITLEFAAAEPVGGIFATPTSATLQRVEHVLTVPAANPLSAELTP